MLQYRWLRLVGVAIASASLSVTPLVTNTLAAARDGARDGDDASRGSAPGMLGGKAPLGNKSAYKLKAEPEIGIVADSGFRPDKNGLPFPNYGTHADDQQAADLSAVEMRKLFGDGVCIGGDGDNCNLTPQAEEWMTEQNKGLGGGHCYGFTVTSLLMWKKDHVTSDQFGASDVPSLKLKDNVPLQRQLAYAATTQVLDQITEHRFAGTANEILDKLITSLRADAPETYTLGFFKRDMTGGHAVTPYAVKYNGDGKYDVLIYDNNYPKEQRVMKFNETNNSWSYDASINPSVEPELYEGDSSNKQQLDMDPVSLTLHKSPAPFTEDGSSRQEDIETEVYLDGDLKRHAHLLITDDKGNRTGFAEKDGKLVNEIPGAKVNFPESGGVDTFDESPEPRYTIPAGVNFKVAVDGTTLKENAKTDIGVSFGSRVFHLHGIEMEPGTVQTLDVSRDAERISYEANDAQSPTVSLSNGQNGDYYDLVGKMQLKAPGAATFDIVSDGSKFALHQSGSEADYEFTIKHETGKGKSEHAIPRILLAPGATATLDLPSWAEGNGKPFEIGH
ncbi:hypothetical protein SNOUR_01525 [Streptomyces noursei ATCC 11455]|nr:hypothetical protein SNOUR_01525 [Streptomyces noursei ATCC 11455]